MLDERPIKPDPKYLEEFINKINKVQTKPYLKKNPHPKLPCNEIDAFNQKQKTINRSKSKTKAEIYEAIKKKNIERFGQKKIEPKKTEEVKPKIHPSKITINYKAKPKIEIEQYKHKNYTPTHKQNVEDDKDKVQYEKLIEYFRKEVKALEQQKQQFNKVANKLHFKKMISSQSELTLSKVKKEAQLMLLRNSFNQKENVVKNKNNQQIDKSPKNDQLANNIATTKSLKFSKTFSVGDLKNFVQKTTQKMQSIKTQILNKDLNIHQHRYDISDIHLLPSFDPQAIFDYINPQMLRYSSNEHYKCALIAFNSKFIRIGNHQDQLCGEDQPCKSTIKTKFIGEKRVSQYEGWTEVWIPGKQRLMTDNKGYKVVWLMNGDVLQQFNNSIKTYFSKIKQISRIQYKDFPAIYYHEGSRQIWKYLQNGTRQTIFYNGRKQIITNLQK